MDASYSEDDGVQNYHGVPQIVNGKIQGCLNAWQAIAFGERANLQASQATKELLLGATEWREDKAPYDIGPQSFREMDNMPAKAKLAGWECRGEKREPANWFLRSMKPKNKGRRVIVGHDKSMNALSEEICGRTVVFPALGSGHVCFGPREGDEENMYHGLVKVSAATDGTVEWTPLVDAIPLAGAIGNLGNIHFAPGSRATTRRDPKSVIGIKARSVEALFLENHEIYLCIILDNGYALRFRGPQVDDPRDVIVKAYRA